MQQTTELNFEYLRPPQHVLSSIRHDKEYIKKGKRSKSQRRIWETVPYDEYEQEKMGDFLKEIQKAGIVLPNDWQPSDTLRICYLSKFKSSNYLKNIRNNIQWRANPLCHSPSDLNIAFLNTGVIYTCGRDKQYRPVIIMNLELVNLSQFNEDTYINAMSYFLGLIKKYCFVPGIIENWIFIMDTKSLGITQFPFKVLGTAISTMQTNFCGCLEKLYMLNPSTSLSFSWTVISSMSDPDSISKVSFLKPKEYVKMQDKISPNQIEQQYGGTVPNLTRFWPPINLEIPGGYPPEVLAKVEALHVGKIDIKKETPVAEEDQAKLQQQLQNLKISQQEQGDDDA